MHLTPEQMRSVDEDASGSEATESKFEATIYILMSLIFGFLIFSIN
jgi:hypothetical protein